jgi:hypothetical protein
MSPSPLYFAVHATDLLSLLRLQYNMPTGHLHAIHAIFTSREATVHSAGCRRSILDGRLRSRMTQEAVFSHLVRVLGHVQE